MLTEVRPAPGTSAVRALNTNEYAPENNVFLKQGTHVIVTDESIEIRDGDMVKVFTSQGILYVLGSHLKEVIT
jgi:hypothetical protein